MLALQLKDDFTHKKIVKRGFIVFSNIDDLSHTFLEIFRNFSFSYGYQQTSH